MEIANFGSSQTIFYDFFERLWLIIWETGTAKSKFAPVFPCKATRIRPPSPPAADAPPPSRQNDTSHNPGTRWKNTEPSSELHPPKERMQLWGKVFCFFPTRAYPIGSKIYCSGKIFLTLEKMLSRYSYYLTYQFKKKYSYILTWGKMFFNINRG